MLKANPLIRLIDEVARFGGRVQSLFEDVHSETGLKTMENLVLNAIVEADFTPTVPQIGRSLGHPRQVIQRTVNDLVDAGFVEKLPNPDHKRAPLLGVTKKGSKLKEWSDTQALAVANAFLGNVDPCFCEKLALELKEVRKAIEVFSRDNV